MNSKNLPLIYLLLFTFAAAYAQTQETKLKWFNPAENEYPCIQQRGFVDEMQHSYARFPDRAENKIRKDVWNLSRNNAGVGIYFYTNASEIHIRYKVSGSMNMGHMPSTGVSGIDLYWVNRQGEWIDFNPNWHFGDTVKYDYSGLDTTLLQEYRMFLPLYNSVTWMEIGVPENAKFEFATVRREKPIVVYGTSIAQGGCASRPGNAWTNVLARNLDLPVVNFGFSGNGRLEEEVIDFINEVDGCVYLFDCYPNLGSFEENEITTRTINAVKQIRAKHDAPIVIVEHTGFNHTKSMKKHQSEVEKGNNAAHHAYNSLKNEIKDLYILTFDESVRTPETTVEGVHPNDYGMIILAAKHEEFLRKLLKMPKGNKATTIPVTQRREPYIYGWMERHQDILKQNAESAPKNIIMGNSITHYWGGAHSQENGKQVWKKYMQPAGYRNMGCGWDYVENVLWRVYHGELDGFNAEKIIVNIGTNNFGKDSDEDIVEGVVFLLNAIRERQPKARIKFVGIYPRRNSETRVEHINRLISNAIMPLGYEFYNPGVNMLQPNGKIDENLFIGDGLHPNEKGYEKIVEDIIK